MSILRAKPVFFGAALLFLAGCQTIEPTGIQNAKVAMAQRIAAEPSGDYYIGRRRSEEHTSELQSPCNLVCRLLLEKKKILSREPQVVVAEVLEWGLRSVLGGGEVRHLHVDVTQASPQVNLLAALLDHTSLCTSVGR